MVMWTNPRPGGDAGVLQWEPTGDESSEEPAA